MRRQVKLPEKHYGWWRFNRYVIQDAVIRPAPGSPLRWYDPWAEFQQIRKQTNGQPAYIELVQLANSLEADSTTHANLARVLKESESQILAWCERHGLLGSLLSRWVSLTLWPVPVARDPEMKIQTRYLRGYGTTVAMQETTGNLPDDARSSVLIHALHDLNIKEEALEDTWHHFFPLVPWAERETFAYPPPYSEAFWQLYSEPVSEFRRAARLLAGAVVRLSPPGKGSPGERRSRALAADKDPVLARAQAIEAVNLLRKDVSQVVIDEGDELRQQWVSPSLVASFAEMLVQDVVSGHRIQYCACCGHEFVTESYQARYCSRACRLRQQKRNLRAQMKGARARYGRGQTIRQIARSLNEAPEMVQRWVVGLKRGRKARHS